MAEGQRFELWEPFDSLHFKCSALDHSATRPVPLLTTSTDVKTVPIVVFANDFLPQNHLQKRVVNFTSNDIRFL